MNDFTDSASTPPAACAAPEAGAPLSAQDAARIQADREDGARHRRRVQTGILLLAVLGNSMLMAGNAFVKSVMAMFHERNRFIEMTLSAANGKEADVLTAAFSSHQAIQAAQNGLVMGLGWSGMGVASAIFLFLWGAKLGSKAIRTALMTFAATFFIISAIVTLVSTYDQYRSATLVEHAQAPSSSGDTQ